ncbi:MAG: hypothetical protein ABFC89_10885 [Methanospirillum sp.]
MILQTAWGFWRRFVSIRFAPEPGTTVFSSAMYREPITAPSASPSCAAELIVPIRGYLLKYSIRCVMITSPIVCIHLPHGKGT